MITRYFNILFLPIMVLSSLASCNAGGGNNHCLPQGDTISVNYATNLTMVDYGNFIKADFRNPWDTTRTLQSFLLVPSDNDMPANLPEGTVIRTPLKRSIVYTSIHGNLVDELGAADAIIGVCDAKYQRNLLLRKRIEESTIADCGSANAPNIEKILQLNPDAILLSAFENSNDHNKVGQTGIPIVDCTDYMENSPLARAEWMRFFGRLYGKGKEADSLFAEVEQAYHATKARVKDVTTRPKVLTELIYGQAWSMPGAYSTVGVLIEDAGGINPFSSFKKSGSVQLSPEEVLYRAEDADIWLIKYYRPTPLTLTELNSDNPIYSQFGAWQEHNVYGCNTQLTSFFDDAAFHPHWVLAEYASLFHPELGEIEGNRHYYTRLTK